jgi:phosphatidylinositol alpha-1,6-mannosyltransferase
VVTSKFAPHSGGTAVVWGNWCNHWPAEQLTVIAPRCPGWQEYDRSVGFRIIRLGYPDIPKLRMPLLWLFLCARTLWECWRRPPELIHYVHVFENGFFAPLVKRFFGIKYWTHTCGEELVFAQRFGWLQRLVSWVLRESSGVTANSRFTAERVKAFGYQKECLIAHPGVDVRTFSPGKGNGVMARHNVPEGRVLLTIGRLMERKGHDVVIRLLPRLLTEFPDLNYVIAGIGPEAERLRSLATEVGVSPRVFFLGRVAAPDMPRLLRECTLFVHPNRVTEKGDVEGFGVVFLEAAGCGAALIAGDSGGVPDSVSAENGLLVDGEDPDSVFEAIHLLLRDDQLRQRLAAEGPAWAAKFSWKLVAESLWAVSIA